MIADTADGGICLAGWQANGMVSLTFSYAAADGY